MEFNLADPSITIDEVLDNLQEAINRWEGGLKTTGGALVPSKSWVYPISIQFDDEGDWSYESLSDIDYTVTVKDHEDNTQEMPLEEAHVAKKTLGVFLAPDGNKPQNGEIRLEHAI